MPLDLLNSNDPLLSVIPREFLRGFDERAVARRLPGWLVRSPRYSSARLAVAEWLRQGWCKQHLTEARVLNEARYRAVAVALDEEITPLEIAWAIVAYGRECGSDKARLANPLMRRSFEAFLTDALERYIPLGAKLLADEKDRRRRIAERKKQQQQAYTADGLRERWHNMPRDQQQTMIRTAVARLAARSVIPMREDFSNPMVRSAVYQLLQEQAKAESAGIPRVGQAVEDALEVRGDK